MMAAIEEISKIVYYCFPLFSLFVVFMAGYYWAWTDFKPKKARGEKSFFSSVNIVNEIKPLKKKKELTRSELGIYDLDSTAALPLEQQRLLKMQQKTREFSQNNPENTAEIIKGWLNAR